MWYAELRNSLLEARDQRQKLLDAMFPAPSPTVLMLSLNLPGDEKGGERARRLFQWGEQELFADLPVLPVLRGSDALGPFGLYRSPLEPAQAKRLAMEVECRHPAGRLLDLDIYDLSGRAVDRSGLGVSPRSCLICPEPAVVCIRAGRHSSEELKAKAKAVIDAL